MSDKPRVPGPTYPAANVRPVPSGRAPAGGPPLLLPTTEQPIVRTALPAPAAPIAVQEVPLLSPTPPPQTPARTSAGRPTDVHWTSNPGVSLVASPSTDGAAALNPPAPGRPMDVQQIPSKPAANAERSLRAPRHARKPKPKTELDERGRFRHTLRLTQQSEQKLQEIAQSMGVDLNAAISVCIASYHQGLAKRGKGDG